MWTTLLTSAAVKIFLLIANKTMTKVEKNSGVIILNQKTLRGHSTEIEDLQTDIEFVWSRGHGGERHISEEEAHLKNRCYNKFQPMLTLCEQRRGTSIGAGQQPSLATINANQCLQFVNNLIVSYLMFQLSMF